MIDIYDGVDSPSFVRIFLFEKYGYNGIHSPPFVKVGSNGVCFYLIQMDRKECTLSFVKLGSNAEYSYLKLEFSLLHLSE
jgi:hypothetical protein